jgi:hypothetical protein
MSPARKIELVFDAYRTGQLLSMAGIRNQYPSASEDEVWHIWAKRHLGEELYNKVYCSTKCPEQFRKPKRIDFDDMR